jgi:hypothetical protein
VAERPVSNHRLMESVGRSVTDPAAGCDADRTIRRVHAPGGRRGKVTIAWPGPTVMSPLEFSVWMESSR